MSNPRLQKILVPVDFTKKNKAALDYAKHLAHQNKSDLTLIHVIETIEYADDEEVADFYEKLKKRSKTQLQMLVDLLSADNINAEGKTVLGHRARGIVSYAMRHNMDLIVLSSHRIDPTEPAKSLSTLSYQVSVLCQCPVLLVK